MKSFSSFLLAGSAALALLAPGTALATATDPEDAQSVPARFTIPMHETHGGQYAVPTTVEGYGPMDFLVDTGANRTAVLTPLAVKLGLLTQEEHETILYGMTGSVETRVLRVDSLDFGTGDVGPLDTALVPLGPDVYLTAYGLLGADAFEDDIIAVDLRADELRIGVPTPSPSLTRNLFQIDEEGLLRATVFVSGVRAVAIVDTGSTRTIGNSALINAVGASRPAMFVDLSGVTPSSGGQAGTVLVESMRLGDVCQRSFRMLRADLAIFDTLDIGNEPAVIVGLDFLEDATITIDRPRGVFEVTGGRGVCRGRSTSLRD